jgi:hypothetical protein
MGPERYELGFFPFCAAIVGTLALLLVCGAMGLLRECFTRKPHRG